MKKVLKFTVMAALLFNTVIANANESNLKIVVDGTSKSLIFNLDATSNDTRVQLSDSQSNVIYADAAFKKKSLRTKYDLSKLDVGTYTFKVEDLTKIVRYTILIDVETISILEKEEVTKPVFRAKGNMIYINLMNTTKKDVEIIIYDAYDRLLYTERISNQLIIEKAINFKSAYKGEYKVIVKDANGNYQKSVQI